MLLVVERYPHTSTSYRWLLQGITIFKPEWSCQSWFHSRRFMNSRLNNVWIIDTIILTIQIRLLIIVNTMIGWRVKALIVVWIKRYDTRKGIENNTDCWYWHCIIHHLKPQSCNLVCILQNDTTTFPLRKSMTCIRILAVPTAKPLNTLEKSSNLVL